MHIISLPATPNMIGYGALTDTGGDKKTASPEGGGSTPDSSSASSSDKRNNVSLQLTPLWEHVVRTQSLPEGVELQQIFLELSDRLRDPEWEVRQHALRVLIDVIPVIIPDRLDEKVAIILNDLIENLGHPAPAVRKGALDSLRVYLSHSKHSEEVLQTIAYEGLENISDHHLQGNVTVGLILSLPSLIFPHKNNGYNVEYPNVQYIVRLLTRKLVQVIFQEVTLRTLVKIRQLIGDDKFNEYLDDIAPLNKTDFNLLCEVYNINSDNDHFQLADLNMNKRMIFEPSVFQQTKYWNTTSSDTFDLTVDNIPQVLVPFPTPINKPNKLTDGKIILKTEIKLNSETALTMTILEEKSEKDLNSESDEDDDELNIEDGGGVVKVLTDDSEFDDDFTMRRRTPRRVRFGGEVVKLRTPDSDTTMQSDDEQLSITSDNKDNDDVIEITLSTNVKTHQIVQKRIPRNSKHRSYIPIPISRTSQIKLDIVPINKQQITKTSSAPSSPQRAQTKLQRKLVYQSTPDLAKEYFKTSKNTKKLDRKNNNSLSTNKRKPSRADDVFSPIPVHEEVQVLHNLQAIDQKYTNKKCTTPGSSGLSINNNKENIDENNLRKHFESTVNEMNKELKYKHLQSNINWCADEEESVTSSSGSSTYSNEKSWEDLNLVDAIVIKDLHDKENWRSRVRGREALLSALHTREVLNGIESRASSFLHLLFSSDRHPRVLAVTQEIISMVIDSFSVETLQSRLSQITAGLARIGGPISIKLSTQLMKKLTPATVAEHFLNNHSLTGRSSKVKENALQIVIYTVLKFPSTEFNVASLASRCGVSVIDRKRRVRHASLELLALLGQIGSVGLVVDAIQTTFNNIEYKTKDEVLEAIRARLSRKQLPAADENFIVTYAPLTDATGADVDWIYAGSGSMSPSSAKMKANAIYRSRLHSAEPIFFHTSNERYANPWEEPTAIATNNNDKYQNRPRTTGYKDEFQPYSLDTSRVWAIDPSLHPVRSSFSSGPIKPIYIVKNNNSSHEQHQQTQRSFPPLNKERTNTSAETQNPPSNSTRYYSKSPFSTANSSYSSSGSTDSPVRKQNPRRDRFSGIPVPAHRGGGTTYYHQTSNQSHHHSSRNKIPSAPVISSERQNDLQSGYIRHTISSGSDLQHFYNTPPAESYLPPIELTDKHKSSASISSSHTDSIDDQDQDTYVPDSPITISSRSRSAASNSYLNKDTPEDVSTSAYVTSERSTSFESSPAKSEKKIVSDSDFDIEDTNVQVQDEDAGSVSGGYKSASSTNLSNYENDSGIVIEVTSPDIEIIERKSVNSAPAQQTSTEPIIENTVEDLSNTALNSSTKSLPGSIISLEKVPKAVELPPSKPHNYLLKRQKLNAKQTVGRLLNGSSHRSQNTAIKSSQVCPFPDTLKPFDKPKEAFNMTMNQLDNTDWEVTVSGLQNLVRLIRFHPDLIENQMHPVAVSLGRQIKNLRSQVARSACMAAVELFSVPKRALEIEMEEIAAPLLHRTADTNKFLRGDANAALTSMCTNMPPSKVINILAARGAMHHNAVVRCATARHICSIVERLGYEKIFQLPRETRDRLIITSANLLTEGSLETRNHAKQIFKNLMHHYNYQKVILDVVPASTMRHISKTLKSIK